MEEAAAGSTDMGISPACRALGVARSSLYRHRRPPPAAGARVYNCYRSLKEEERQNVLSVLNSERFMDQAPAEIYATLLDEGVYLCSVRTMYRILAQNDQVRERRNQVRHPNYTKPELLATAPNQVWSWDITKLKGPEKWTYFYLYVMIDIFSRYVVGWMVAHRESKRLAERFIQETVEKQGIVPGQLTIHADRGSSMTSKPVASLLAELGITKTHSRPYTSNDNPYSESHFKTLKYSAGFPSRFGCIEDARFFCGPFFSWYNTEHHHSGIGLLIPEALHYGRAEEVTVARKATLLAAYANHPERFNRPPQPPKIPNAAWINQPASPLRDDTAGNGHSQD